MRRVILFAAATLVLCGTANAGQGEKRVSEVTFQGEYPLTRPATLRCVQKGGQKIVWVETDDGKTWQVNGAASAYHQAIQPIWKKRTDFPSLRVDIGPLIQEGLALCD